MKVKEAFEIIEAALGDKIADKRTKVYKAVQRLKQIVFADDIAIEEEINDFFEEYENDY